MYFIAHGKVAIMNDDDVILNTLEAGSYFGEIGLLTEDKRIATVRALTCCDLCTLKKQDFLDLMNDHPEVRNKIQLMAIRRLSSCGFQKPSIQKLKKKFSPSHIQSIDSYSNSV